MSGGHRRPDYLRTRVRQVRALSPYLIRVVFGGGDLDRFAVTDHADQRVHLALPDPGRDEPPAPADLGGVHDYPPEARRPETRSYTVRAWDPARAELVVDFALHASGAGVDWVRRAEPGAVVYLSADVGWYRPPADTTWWLLAADLAGLPALSRIVESLSDGVPARVLAEVPTADDAPPWHGSAADLSVTWLVGSGNGTGPSGLAEAVREVTLPAGPGYVWTATEAGTARAIRRHVRRVWCLEVARFDISGYWRADQEAWMARFTAVEERMEAVWEAALRDGTSEADAIDILDDALERAGL